MGISDAEYIARAKEVVAKAEQKREGYRGHCNTCRYYGGGWRATCHHPAVQLAGFNETESYRKSVIVRCDEQRDTSSHYGPVLCGPNGALHDEKITLWAALKSKLSTAPAP